MRADAFLAQPRGLYAQVYLRRNFTIDDAAKRTRFQCAAFHLTRDGAKPQDGYLCVTSWNNKFVKLRLTTLRDNNTEATARKYVSALDAGAVGRRRHLARRAGSRTGPFEPRPQVRARHASGSSRRRRGRGRHARKATSAKCAESLSGRRRPHCADHFGDLVRIGHRQRAGLADADERRAARRGRDLVACAGWLAGSAPASRRAQHDAIEERQLQRRRGEARVRPHR